MYCIWVLTLRCCPLRSTPPCRDKAPGQRECDDAIEVLNNCIREVDQASLAAISQQLTPREDISHEVPSPCRPTAMDSIDAPISVLSAENSVSVQ